MGNTECSLVGGVVIKRVGFTRAGSISLLLVDAAWFVPVQGPRWRLRSEEPLKAHHCLRPPEPGPPDCGLLLASCSGLWPLVCPHSCCGLLSTSSRAPARVRGRPSHGPAGVSLLLCALSSSASNKEDEWTPGVSSAFVGPENLLGAGSFSGRFTAESPGTTNLFCRCWEGASAPGLEAPQTALSPRGRVPDRALPGFLLGSCLTRGSEAPLDAGTTGKGHRRLRGWHGGRAMTRPCLGEEGPQTHPSSGHRVMPFQFS
ncbi:hypothetical protein NDU88_006037 [Pleurodeles waltl]|uniref:Uncharacterized protein n=1 Tax=Pleurodeles waltl TaxID=8319 RepID=A0AAV7L480_PLEWA|nr:hypothetical protein NDU88_006037 [Pleurodeles waltl]